MRYQYSDYSNFYRTVIRTMFMMTAHDEVYAFVSETLPPYPVVILKFSR